MKKLEPNKEYMIAPGVDGNCSCSNCPFMELNTIEKLRDCLKSLSPEIFIDKNKLSLEYIASNIPLKSFFKENFIIDDIKLSTKFLKIGNAAFDPVSNLPRVFGLSARALHRVLEGRREVMGKTHNTAKSSRRKERRNQQPVERRSIFQHIKYSRVQSLLHKTKLNLLNSIPTKLRADQYTRHRQESKRGWQ